MKLIVGLGNPGRQYADSRHNAGFQVVKALARECGASFKRDIGTASLSAQAKIEGKRAVLALPLTFMNLSGRAVSALRKKYKVGLSDVLVVCDDLDLEMGRLKLRPSGSSGGHRGLESIIESLGESGFCRLRLGIGRPPRGEDAADFVLSPMSLKEKEAFQESVEKAARCCRMWVAQGAAEAMNAFNKRSTE